MKYSLAFLAGIALLVALMVVFVVQILNPACLCDGLPGGQCTYCDSEAHSLLQAALAVDANVRDPEYLQHFLQAWETEHQTRHRAWIEQHRELHRQDLFTSEEGHRTYHREMETAHREFHQAFDARLRLFVEENAGE